MKINCDIYQRVHKKIPSGRRTWYFDARVKTARGSMSNIVKHHGTYPEACEAALAWAKQKHPDAEEVVVLLP